MVAMGEPAMSDPFRLDGKAALVTGANTGIGQAIAIGLARAGAEVVAAGRSSLDRDARPDRRRGRCKAPPFELAARRPGEPPRGLLAVGPLDILVNNAGIIRRADAVDFSESDWDKVIDINLKAVFFLSQAFARPAIAARAGGAIVNIASLLVVPGRHPRAGLHRRQARHRRPDPRARQRVGGARASTSTPSRPATSRPTTPRRCAPTRRAARRSSTASRPAAGASPRTSPAPRSSSPRARRSSSTAPSSPSTEAGLPADPPRLTRPGRPAPRRRHRPSRPRRLLPRPRRALRRRGDGAVRRRLGHRRRQPGPPRPARQAGAAGLRLHRARARPRAARPPQVVEVVQDVLVAPEDPEAVLAAMADPAVRIVSLTVTEKGYCHDPASGRLNRAHPDIVHDLAHPQAPRSAPGFLVRALARRRAAGDAPFTVLCCDNLPDNGAMVRGVVLELARLVDPRPRRLDRRRGRLPLDDGRPHRARDQARGHRARRGADRPARPLAGAARAFPAVGGRGRLRRRRPARISAPSGCSSFPTCGRSS